MANAGVEASGLKEALAAVKQLPASVTRALEAVAKATADRIAASAKSALLSKTKAVKTADSIHVVRDGTRKQFVVDVPGSPDDPPKLAFWLEHGTQRMAAKPYLRPAGDAEDERYRRDMADAATRTIRGAVT